MMSRDSISNRVSFRWICPLRTIMAYGILSLLPIGAAAQVPVLTPGLHNLTLPRADEPAIHYAIFIPGNYSPSGPVPLILALHFGVRGGDAAGAGQDVMQVLIGPALGELGAIIVAPDSVRGDWSSPENEKAVNALLDMVMAQYSIDKKRLQSPATAWAAQAPGILRRNSRNASARRFPSPAGRRHPPPRGGFRSWRSNLATTRSYLLIRRRRELRSFRKPV
jgi:hypothetical protein